ncbi:hypothetical protein [Flavobacterium proteolyticum]|uniref:Uncharacterized protein n=1 Tax=Flavobacterium proteolyticum TaxID=2911683 RepID=A0ABR9WME5_9FLAO|nr:hypothetical protein [Flavobacterium proteolyticum]MBE9575083.1 hypothetical protein [Flavobacterium proteolyticum]
MKNINITKRKNHISIELKKESFDVSLKTKIKHLNNVKIFNVIILSDKLKLSVHPYKHNDLDSLKIELEKKIMKN